MAVCPLCQSKAIYPYYEDNRRPYQQCGHCSLVFVEPQFHLPPEQEKAEYDLHQNSPQDKGYQQFLNRIAEPVLQRLSPNSKGLDFGCGPGPTLSLMLEEAGHHVALFDIFYANNKDIWQQHYQFITATEVVEHLSKPGEVLQQLWQHLEAGGILAMMTKLVIDRHAFSNWHYKNDPTHVCFFSRECFHWLSEQWQAKLEFIGQDVILLTKKGSH